MTPRFGCADYRAGCSVIVGSITQKRTDIANVATKPNAYGLRLGGCPEAALLSGLLARDFLSRTINMTTAQTFERLAFSI
jgi:hypothetical protein